MKMTKKTTVWVINLENTEKTLQINLYLKCMVVGKKPINLFSRVFLTKVTTYLKCVELCKFVCPDVKIY